MAVSPSPFLRAATRLPPVLRGILWMLLCVVSLASVMVSVKALKDDLHTFQLLFLRAGTAFALLLALMGRGGFRRLATVRPFFHVGRALIHQAGQFLIFVGIVYLPLAQVTAIEFAIPIFTALIAAAALGERLGPGRIVGLAVGFAGVLVIVRPWVEAIHFAAVAAVASTACFGTANVMTKALRQTETADQVVFYMHLVQTTVALAPALLVWNVPTPWMLPWIVLMGFGSLASHYALARAVALAEVTVVAPMDFLRLPITALIAWLIWGEGLSVWTALGAAMIFGASYWNARRETRAARRAE